MTILLPEEKEVPIEDILEYTNNTKIHTVKQIENISKSISKFGFTQPILLDSEEKKIIVAGHGRFLASKKLGILRKSFNRQMDCSHFLKIFTKRIRKP